MIESRRLAGRAHGVAAKRAGGAPVRTTHERRPPSPHSPCASTTHRRIRAREQGGGVVAAVSVPRWLRLESSTHATADTAGVGSSEWPARRRRNLHSAMEAAPRATAKMWVGSGCMRASSTPKNSNFPATSLVRHFDSTAPSVAPAPPLKPRICRRGATQK